MSSDQRVPTLDPAALNEAKWAACNMRWLRGPVPSMDDIGEAVERAIQIYEKLLHRPLDNA